MIEKKGWEESTCVAKYGREQAMTGVYKGMFVWGTAGTRSGHVVKGFDMKLVEISRGESWKKRGFRLVLSSIPITLNAVWKVS